MDRSGRDSVGCRGVVGVSVGVAHAHHSFAMYDLKKTYVMTGVVTRVDPNPNHLQLFFAPLNEARDQVIRDNKGEPIVWALEMDAAAGAARDGITRQQFSARHDHQRRPASAAQRFSGRRPRQERTVQVPGRHAARGRQALRLGEGLHVARRRCICPSRRTSHLRVRPASLPRRARRSPDCSRRRRTRRSPTRDAASTCPRSAAAPRTHSDPRLALNIPSSRSRCAGNAR